MKTKVVRFGRLKSYGSFENMRIDIEAEVEKNETPEIVLDRLQEEVDKQISERINRPYIDYTNSQLESKRKELDEVTVKVSKLQRKLLKMQELFAEEVEPRPD